MIPLFDRLNQTRVRNANSVTGFLSLTVSLLALASLPAVSRQVRPIVYAVAALSSLTATTSFRTRDQQVSILFDHETLADQARQNATQQVYAQDGNSFVATNLFNPPIPIDQPLQDLPQESPSQGTVPLFDWSLLATQADEYPHVAILNKTGGGKSVLAQWLAKSMGGKIIVLDPHYEPGSYEAADIVTGVGRNTGESAESWQEILDKKGNVVGEKGEPEIDQPHQLASCTQMINWIHREMVSRYQLRAQGQKEFETLNIILDEFSSYSKKEGVSVRFKELIREARKVRIRLYVLIQGSQVSDLGLEGSSDLRSNLTFIRLGKFALEYANSQLRNAKPNTVAYQEWSDKVKVLRQANRPALVEEIPADVPNLA